MSKSRLVFLFWILWTVFVAGVYIHAMLGFTEVSGGRLSLATGSTLELTWSTTESTGFRAEHTSWKAWNETTKGAPEEKENVRWDQLHCGHFAAGSYYGGRYLAVPLWCPWLAVTVLAFFLRRRLRRGEWSATQERHA